LLEGLLPISEENISKEANYERPVSPPGPSALQEATQTEPILSDRSNSKKFCGIEIQFQVMGYNWIQNKLILIIKIRIEFKKIVTYPW